jgi:lysyl endopeptidase
MKGYTFRLFCGLVYFLPNFISAQIATDELPISSSPQIQQFLETESPSFDMRIMKRIDINEIREEDKMDEELGLPPRFGYPIESDLNLDNSGTWTELPNGDKLWQLGIKSSGALSINLLYDKFWIPEGAQFFLYSEDRRHSIGAITSVNNKGSKEDILGFATGLIYGESVILEYYLPNNVEDKGVISIAGVVHGYRYINLNEFSTKGLGDSGNCQVNINCIEGDNWQQEKNAVAMILVGGIRICTGSLINTTCNDNRPVFLTANHCLDGADAIGNPQLNNWSFYWHYEGPSCANPTSQPPILSTVGANVIANNPNTDFALLNLTEDPRERNGVTPFYLGWDRTGNSGTGGVGIHHPRGDIKKIATYTISPSNSDCFSSGNQNYWKINWASTTNGHSVTEGGSSGSPLINSNKRVIGQLLGAGPFCPNPNCFNPSEDIGNYGKFSVSWTGNGASDNRRRLDHWLHPGGGTAPNTLNGIATMNVSGSNLLCSSGSYSLQNLPSGFSVSWTVSPTNLFSGSTTGTGNVANLSINNSFSSGQATLTYNIQTNCGETQVSRNFWVGRPGIPSLIQGNITPSIGSYETYSVPSLPNGATSISWVLPYCFGCNQPWSIYSGQNLTQMVAIVGDSDGYVQAIGSNACGSGGASLLYVTPDTGPCNPCPLLIYPNPASDELTFEWEISEDEHNQVKVEEYELSIFDSNGALLFSLSTEKPKVKINVLHLKVGFYYLHITNKNGLIRKQLRVER